MFSSRVSSWNLRDRHMAETLAELDGHLSRRRGRPARFAVWAHNSHLGDARATEMGESGELNLGQLVRERHGAAAALLGFTTYRGSVTAASDWDMPAETKSIRPGLAGSCEALFHDVGNARFRLVLRGNAELAEALAAPRLQRAIGVIYRPETERHSHYFHAACRASSTRSSISTRRERWCRSSRARRAGADERAARDLSLRRLIGTAGEPTETYRSGT